MFTFIYKLYFIGFFLFYTTTCLPQQPEINDQFESTTKTIKDNTISIDDIKVNKPSYHSLNVVPTTIFKIIIDPFKSFLSTPKVSAVLRNIGTCIVNGILDIISYYVPAPFIPVIASIAGLMIPFEPVVMLKEKMPVTSYRRAFSSAMNSFMRTFDKYKVDDPDPYMTRRFNRRLMDDPEKEDGIKS